MSKLDRDQFNISLSKISCSEVKGVDENSSPAEVLKQMIANQVDLIPVEANKKIVGIISEREILSNFESLGNETIENLTIKKIETLKEDSSIKDAVDLFVNKGIYTIPLVNNEGITTHLLTPKDIMKFIIGHFEESVVKLGTLTTEEISNEDALDEAFVEGFTLENDGHFSPYWFFYPLRRIHEFNLCKIDINSTLEEGLKELKEANFFSAVVVSHETIIEGIITIKDFISKVFANNINIKNNFTRDFMTKSPHCLFERHKLAYAINNMLAYNYRNMIIINGDGIPTGVVSLIDILKFILPQCLKTFEV